MDWRSICALACLGVGTSFPLAKAAYPDGCVPARWQGGPLEVQRRVAGAKASLDPEIASILKNWYRTSTLDLLKDTPINCLLVTWSAGPDTGQEREQQRLVAEYAKEAHQRGLAVFGILYPGSDAERAAKAALGAKLDGLVLEGEHPGGRQIAEVVRVTFESAGGSLPLIPLATPDWLAEGADWPVAGTSGGSSPGVRVMLDSGGTMATPTSEPWIDSNTWLVRSLHARSGLPVWLGFQPDLYSSGDYARAIADAAAVGGHWVLSPDDKLIASLWKKQPAAIAAWRRIADCLKFHEARSDWQGFLPVGPLLIVQDSFGPHADMSGENLNLIARRRIPFRVIERRGLTQGAVEGAKAVLATDLAPPAKQERELLAAYAGKGGVVVTGPSWGTAIPPDRESTTEFSGKGSIVVYKDDPPDPETLARDMLSLLGRGNLGIRLFNVPSVLPYVSANRAGTQLLVQLINYATAPAEAVTVRIGGDYRSARLYSPDGLTGDPAVERSEDRMEVRIPRIPVYAALLLEK